MPGGIRLVMELGLRFMHLYIFIKFDEDRMKTVLVVEQKSPWIPIFKKLKGITPECLIEYNLVIEICLYFVLINIFIKFLNIG